MHVIAHTLSLSPRSAVSQSGRHPSKISSERSGTAVFAHSSHLLTSVLAIDAWCCGTNAWRHPPSVTSIRSCMSEPALFQRDRVRRPALRKAIPHAVRTSLGLPPSPPPARPRPVRDDRYVRAMALVGVFPPARSFVRWLQARVWSAGSKSSSSSATFGMCDTHTRTHGCGVGLAMEADG